MYEMNIYFEMWNHFSFHKTYTGPQDKLITTRHGQRLWNYCNMTYKQPKHWYLSFKRKGNNDGKQQYPFK